MDAKNAGLVSIPRAAYIFRLGRCVMLIRLIAAAAALSLLMGCAGAPAGKTGQASGARTSASPAAVKASTAALLAAIRSANVSGARAALDSGADPDLPGEAASWSRSGDALIPLDDLPLFAVVCSDKLSGKQKAELIGALKKAGADMNIRNAAGETALERLLTIGGSPDAVLALLEAGADPNAAPGGMRAGSPPLLFAMLGSSRYPPEEKAAMLSAFAARKADMNAKDASGVPLIHRIMDWPAGMTGREALLRILLEAGADPNAVDEKGGSVLYVLLVNTEYKGYLDLLRLAVRRGADPARLNPYGNTALAEVCQDLATPLARIGVKETEVMDVLLSAGAAVDMADADGKTALFFAANARRGDLARYLAGKGARIDAKDKEGNTALLYMFQAIAAVPDDLLKILTGPGADLDAQDPDGNTALNLAAGDDRYLNVVQRLVDAGADPALSNDDELAPLGTATQYGAKKNAALLKTKGGPLYVSRYPAGNKAPACAAVLSADLAAVQTIPLAEFSVMNGRTSLGVPATPLHLAAERGDLSVIKTLCGRKADWNVPDRYGRTPLQCAVLDGRADIADLLLSAGADPNRADNYGMTAFRAAATSRPEMARAMLARGFVPADEGAASGAVWTGNLDLLKALYAKAVPTQTVLDMCAGIGEVEMTEYIGSRMAKTEKPLAESVEQARNVAKARKEADAAAAVPLEAPKKTGGIGDKRGTFMYTVESWSPWMKMEADKKLKDYPVAIYVPKNYDGSKPCGLLVSMIHAQSSNQYPRPEFQKILDEKKIIWAGFDPYNGIYEEFKGTHECFCLAIVYNLLGYYSLDRSRIYLAGFSWGGRLTGDIVTWRPGVFKGGIAVGGCFTSRFSGTPSLGYGQSTIAMVMCTGDYDYNRKETFGGYSTLTRLGYENCLFIQEPLKGHSVLSAAVFEKALGFLDAQSSRR